MQARDAALLKLLAEKADAGDEQAKSAHDYVALLFVQLDKREAINRTMQTLYVDENYLEKKQMEMENFPDVNSIKCDVKRREVIRNRYECALTIRRYERIIPQLKERLAKLQAEYDAEYGA